MSETRIPPIGTLTDRIQLQRRTTTAEDEGGAVAAYASIATVWARVRTLAARQSFAADGRGQAITHAVTLRFRTGIVPGDRVLYRGRVLEIASVADINGRRAYLSLQCSERAVTG